MEREEAKARKMTRGEIDGILASMKTWIDENAVQIEKDYKYDGFDAVAMRRELDDDYEKMDINNIVVFCIMRGTRIETTAGKKKIRISEQGLARIRKSLAVLKGKRGAGAKEVTISRVCCCFPEMCAGFLRLKPQFVKGTLQEGLPTYLCFPQGASLIPTTSPELYKRWTDWATSFATLIKADSKKDPSIFWRASHCSQIFHDDARADILRQMVTLDSILNADGTDKIDENKAEDLARKEKAKEEIARKVQEQKDEIAERDKKKAEDSQSDAENEVKYRNLIINRIKADENLTSLMSQINDIVFMRISESKIFKTANTDYEDELWRIPMIKRNKKLTYVLNKRNEVPLFNLVKNEWVNVRQKVR
jgi:hypothetical protein